MKWAENRLFYSASGIDVFYRAVQNMFSTIQQSTKLCNLMIHYGFSPLRVF